jgi:hypothetical protein
MAVLTDVGYVAQPGEDFASTGPHLHVSVLKDGKDINPETIRSLLTRLKVGKGQTPLWQQQGEKWQAAAPITSGFGPREAPTAGASTFHRGQDYGFSAGTSLAWEGPGTFTPEKGYGSIKTTDAQGNPYEIRLLHTKGGKSAEVTSAAQALLQTTQQSTEDPGKEQLKAYLQKNNELISQLTQQLQSTDEPTGAAEMMQKLLSTPGSSQDFLNTAIAAAAKPVQYV